MHAARISVLVAIIAVCGCTTTKQHKAIHPPALAEDRVEDSNLEVFDALATAAYFLDGSLYLEARKTEFPSYRIAKSYADSSISKAGPSGKPGNPPILVLADLTPSLWNPTEGTNVPIFGVELWDQLRDGVRMIVTPRESGYGVVVDLLNEQDLFHYYDEIGTLRTVPIIYKPESVRVKETYSFEEVVRNSLPAVRQVLSGDGAPLHFALMNTGDDAEGGFPFVFLDFRQRQAIFLRSPASKKSQAGAGLGTKLQAATHLTTSHVRTVFEQPVTALTRLFTLATRATTDLLDPRGLLPIEHGPIPPVADAAGMDMAQWETELDRLTGTQASQGRIEVLVDGREFFPRMIDSVTVAKKSVKLRTYIFDNDDYATSFAELLKRRSKEIDVRVMVDGLGTIGGAAAAPDYQPPAVAGTDSAIANLKMNSKVRVKVLANPWFAGDHSKVTIVDDRTAFVGGMNIGREYRYEWHDLMLQLEGPVVDVLRTHYEKTWVRQSPLGDLLAPLRHVKPVNEEMAGMYPIRVLTTAPQHTNILKAQIAAIRASKQRVYIQNAYFTSDPILYELAMARRRGVDVRVILPLRGDSGLINRNNAIAANKMLANGIRVYIYPGMSHLKGAVYDGWACLGSANFDALSLEVNRELNVATSHAPVVDELVNRVFLADMEKSAELKEPFPSKWSDFLTELIADRL